ncbi:uncharacterized protein TNCV_1143221 [Trichonephila clavipes]|nr:uncharacterized protein TNCV_1143221 [Trichonephila clavipes]
MSVISRIWQRFQDDGNVSRCCRIGRPRVTMPNEDRYIFGSYCQTKQTEHSIRRVSSALFSYRFNGFKADRVQTLRTDRLDVYMLVGLSDMFHLPQLTVACD